MPQVCVITVDELPFEGWGHGSGKIAKCLTRLSAEAVCFENHYLQSETADHLWWAFSEVTRGVSQGRGPATFIQVDAEDSQTPCDSGMPDWIRSVVQSTSSDNVIQSLTAVAEGSSFSWLRFHRSRSCQLESQLKTISQLSEALREKGFLVLVTCVQSLPFQGLGFDSLLLESEIRVPLWLFSKKLDASRIQAVSGSLDIAFTACRHLGWELRQSKPESELSPRCLLEMAENPGKDRSRRLIIRAKSASAIRSDGFLFVRSESPKFTPGRDERAEALYLKPEDIWNVNDVAVQYPAVVRELGQRC